MKQDPTEILPGLIEAIGLSGRHLAAAKLAAKRGDTEETLRLLRLADSGAKRLARTGGSYQKLAARALRTECHRLAWEVGGIRMVARMALTGLFDGGKDDDGNV